MAPRRQVVAIVCSAPLLAEALAAALAGVADVLALPGRASDLAGLLSSLTPAGVVVDDPGDAAAATEYARRTGAPLVHVRLREAAVAVWDGLGWRELPGEPSADRVRNAVVAGMSARSAA
jgi:hypothetical protein